MEDRRQNRLVVAVSCVFLMVELVLLAASFVEVYHLSQPGKEVGPTFYPRILLVLAIVLTVLVIVRALRRGQERWDPPVWRRVGGAIGLTVLYVVFLGHAGFLPASVFMTVTIPLVLGYRRLRVVLPVGVLYSIAIWFLFEKVLLILLPAGWQM